MLLIEQGIIHPMTGEAWQGDVLVENGRILRLEKRVDPTTLALKRCWMQGDCMYGPVCWMPTRTWD